MRPISKAFFFSLVVLIFVFSPVIGEQFKPDSNLKDANGEKKDLLRKKGIMPIPDPRDRYPSIFNGIEPFPHAGSFEHPLRRDLSYTNSTTPPLTSVEQRAMKTIIDDFLVNDDTTGGPLDEYAPNIARDQSGNFVITWYAKRDGNWDIYAQRYDSSGNPFGSNFKVNDNTDTTYQKYPAIAMDSSGNFVIVWEDSRNGNWDKQDIYAQRYNSSGIPLGSNFKVNDGTGYADPQSPPAIAMNGSGDFVIVWEDDRNGNPDIYAQRYNSTGTQLDSNFKVNDDAVSANQWSPPAIAMDGIGNFVITWYDSRNGNWDIYAQRYNSSGTPADDNFKINDDISANDQYDPAIAMNNSGYFIITWYDLRSGTKFEIYAQRYGSLGSPLDSNFKVNNDTGSTGHGYPAIAVDDSGNFVITWHDDRNVSWDIYAQKYNSSGIPLGSNFKVNDAAGADFPAIAMDGFGNFVITWEDYRSSFDIYAQRFDSSSTPLASNFKVNGYVGGTANQLDPAMALDGSDNFIITWVDWRNSNPDIYAQRYNSKGACLGSNFMVNDDTVMAGQDFPTIAANDIGDFVIAWKDYRNGKWDIYVQRFNSSGIPLGTNFKVNDDTGATYLFSPLAVGMDGQGGFLITWVKEIAIDSFTIDYDIYAQMISNSGIPVGSNFKVNDDNGSHPQVYPAVAMHSSGYFVISWQDNRSGIHIYAQRYSSSGTPLGVNFKVDNKTGWHREPAIASDSSGNFIIVWNSVGDIYTQRYSFTGDTLGSNFKVNDDTGTVNQRYPAISSDKSGKFVIVWEDYRNGASNPDIYGQRYDQAGNSIGGNYLVPNSLYASYSQLYPAVVANNSKIYYTWQDNRRAKGWDVYAKIAYFLRGDANGDNKVTIADIVYLVSYLFKHGPPPKPELGIGDANCDGKVTVADVVYLVSYLFKHGPLPCP